MNCVDGGGSDDTRAGMAAMIWVSTVPTPTVECTYWFRSMWLGIRPLAVRWHRVRRTDRPEQIECYYPYILSYDGGEWSNQPIPEPEEQP